MSFSVTSTIISMGDNMSKLSSSDENMTNAGNCQVIENDEEKPNEKIPSHQNGVDPSGPGVEATTPRSVSILDNELCSRGLEELPKQHKLEGKAVTETDEPPPSVLDRELPGVGVKLSEYHTLPPIGPESVGQDSIDPKDVIRVDERSDFATKKKPELDFFGRPRPKSLVRKWPSMIMYLMSRASDDDWQEVVDRVQSHPEEISMQGINGGMNALHAACVRYPPVHVVEAIIKADPSVITKRNFNGENPLHIATYSSSEEVQALLVRTAPAAAAMKDQYGDSPLHFSARAGATYNLMEAIVAASPAMIAQPNDRGITPFWMLPRTYLETDDLEDVLDVDGEDYRDDWDSLALFLRYSFFPPGFAAPRIRDERGSPLPIRREDYTWIVHAAAAAPSCPREVLKWLCRMFPEQALRLDEHGFTPLLWAVQQKELREPVNWNEVEDGYREHVDVVEGELQNEDERLDEDEAALGAGDSAFLEHVFNRTGDADDESRNSGSDFEYVEESVVEVLLEWSPRSALQADANGRLPLTHALLSGMKWKTSIAKLIAACPRALECCDSETGLYNFMLAAMCSPQLDTVYTLVRSLPALLACSNYGPAYHPKTKAALKSESTNSDTKLAATNETLKTQSQGDTEILDSSANLETKKRPLLEQGDELLSTDKQSNGDSPFSKKSKL